MWNGLKYAGILAGMLCGMTTVSAAQHTQTNQTAPQRTAQSEASIGLNKFDLLKQYLGTASGGDGSIE